MFAEQNGGHCCCCNDNVEHNMDLFSACEFNTTSSRLAGHETELIVDEQRATNCFSGLAPLVVVLTLNKMGR